MPNPTGDLSGKEKKTAKYWVISKIKFYRVRQKHPPCCCSGHARSPQAMHNKDHLQVWMSINRGNVIYHIWFTYKIWFECSNRKFSGYYCRLIGRNCCFDSCFRQTVAEKRQPQPGIQLTAAGFNYRVLWILVQSHKMGGGGWDWPPPGK